MPCRFFAVRSVALQLPVVLFLSSWSRGEQAPRRGPADCLNGPCTPANQRCGQPYGPSAPQYHLMDQHGCGENDPNGPVFDPVHGVFHHFYQSHLAFSGFAPANGPIYGHFVSKDFVHWTQMPVGIWNGIGRGGIGSNNSGS